MRFLLTFFVISCTLFGLGQSSSPIEIFVDPNLRILSDITPDSIPNGRYLVIYHNRTVLQGQTENGKMVGTWTSFYPNGQEKQKGKYLNGEPHGDWTLWNEDGKVLAKFHFQKGKKTGHWEGFFSNGTKSIDFVYSREGKPLQCIQYFPSGLVASNTEYHYQDSIVNSEHSYYFENHNLYHYEQRRNEVRNGDLIRYHSNGVVREHYVFENGLLWSIKETRSELGAPLQNDSLWNGTGPFYKYYPNGNTRSIAHYLEGKQHGSFESFDYGKNTLQKGQFTQGERSGKWKYYSKYHSLRLVKDYDTLAPLVYVIESTSPAPKERSEGTTLNGKKHGTWKSWDAYDELLYEMHYRHGFTDGTQKYYESNKLARQIQMINGNMDGQSIFYNMFGKVLSTETYQSISYLDSNWYVSPISNWVPITNAANTSNKVHLYFYPYWPGMELLSKDIAYPMESRSPSSAPWNTDYSFQPLLKEPSFPEGYLGEKNYISSYILKQKVKLNVPAKGTVMLRYRVDEFGLISEIKILKSIHPKLDEIAENIIKSFPPLHPANYCGIPIPSYVVREIDFLY